MVSKSDISPKEVKELFGELISVQGSLSLRINVKKCLDGLIANG